MMTENISPVQISCYILLIFGIALIFICKTEPCSNLRGKKKLDAKWTSTILETFYFPTWTMSEWWAHAERTLSALWANGESTLNGIWWALNSSERWAKAECKRSANASAKWTWTHGERYVNTGWTIYWECLRSYPYTVFR